jgi:hypothetical protein
MGKKEHIEESIQKKLDAFSAPPPPHIWGNIEGHMLMQKKKRRMAYLAWFSAAAVVVLAFMAGWYFSTSQPQVIPAVSEQLKMEPNNEENSAPIATVEEEYNLNESLREEEPINTLAKAESIEDKQAKALGENKIETQGNVDEGRATIAIQRLAGLEARLNNQQAVDWNELADEKYIRYEQNTFALQAEDKALIAANTQNMKGQITNSNRWILGMHVSPGYSSHAVSHSDSYAQNMNYAEQGGGSNVGGGVSVQYKTDRKLRIESGLYYAQNGHKANNSFSLFAFKENADYVYAPTMAAESTPMFTNSVQVRETGMLMNSTAGVINLNKVPQGAEITARLENGKSGYANTLSSSGEFTQRFEFVEIPLYLRYSVIDKKLGVEILGGINAGVVVGNNAYITNQFGSQNIGSTEDISTINLAGTVGLGMNYALGKHISVALEPRFNYYLSSINSNPDVDYRPYRIGVFTGLYYEF